MNMSFELEDIDLSANIFEDSLCDETDVEINIGGHNSFSNFYLDLKDDTFYPGINAEYPICGSEFSDTEEIELPRGMPGGGSFGLCAAAGIMHEEEEVKLTEEINVQPITRTNEVEKTMGFMDILSRDASWARAVKTEVKLCVGAFPFDKVTYIIKALVDKINNRPPTITILSKKIHRQQLEVILRIMMHSLLNNDEVPVIHSMLRVYLKQPIESFKELCRLVVQISTELPGCMVEHDDIFGEGILDGSKKRLKTSQMRKFFEREEIAKRFNVKIAASLSVRLPGNATRDMAIRWYQEYRHDGLSTYAQIEHFGYPKGRLVFPSGDRLISHNWLIDYPEGEKMIETKYALSAVHDLITFLDIKKNNPRR